MAVKNRIHKGVSFKLRVLITERHQMAMDEEAAQFVLNGLPLSLGLTGADLDKIRDWVLEPGNRALYAAEWEGEHPDREPFPPPFPQRILDILQRGVNGSGEDEDALVNAFAQAITECQNELITEPPMRK